MGGWEGGGCTREVETMMHVHTNANTKSNFELWWEGERGEGVWEGWRVCGRGGEGGKGRGVEGVWEGGGVETMMHVHTNAQQCDC